jgi:hypothetical protein
MSCDPLYDQRIDLTLAATHGHHPTRVGPVWHDEWTREVKDHWWSKPRTVTNRSEARQRVGCVCGWEADGNGLFHAWVDQEWHVHAWRAIAEERVAA